MSRSSPGRYAVHEFSKNVFDVQAFDGKGKELDRDRAAESRISGTSPGTTARCASSTRCSAITWTARIWPSTTRTRT